MAATRSGFVMSTDPFEAVNAAMDAKTYATAVEALQSTDAVPLAMVQKQFDIVQNQLAPARTEQKREKQMAVSHL